MRFFTDPTPYDYRARLCGIPVYVRLVDECTEVAGTNVLFDWLVERWPAVVMWSANTIAGWGMQLGLVNPTDYCPVWEFSNLRKL